MSTREIKRLIKRWLLRSLSRGLVHGSPAPRARPRATACLRTTASGRRFTLHRRDTAATHTRTGTRRHPCVHRAPRATGPAPDPLLIVIRRRITTCKLIAPRYLLPDVLRCSRHAWMRACRAKQRSSTVSGCATKGVRHFSIVAPWAIRRWQQVRAGAGTIIVRGSRGDATVTVVRRHGGGMACAFLTRNTWGVVDKARQDAQGTGSAKVGTSGRSRESAVARGAA